MELRHLRYFLVVAEEENVTRAAERLHLSQPPLSRQIRDLEHELGVELFQRTAKSLTLTEAGKTFLTETRAVLQRVDKAIETVRSVAKGDRGRLHVGYAPSLTVEFLPKALMLFEEAYPGARISLHDLSSEECLQKLLSGKLDVALTVMSGDARGVHFEKIASQDLFCAMSAKHPLARKRSVKWTELREEPFVVYSEEDYPEYLDWIRGLFRPYGFEPRVAGEYDGASGLITAVESGRGIAIVVSSLRRFAGSRLTLLPLIPKPDPIQIGAAFLKNPPPLVEEFIRVVKQAALH